MQVDVELLPAINIIIANTELQLKRIIGTEVRLKLRILNDEINEAFLQSLVCDEFSVTWPQLISASRKKELVVARQVYWWLCRKYTGATMVRLGKEFERHHTTVLHSIEQINDMIDVKDKAVFSHIVEIEKNINA